MKPAVLITGKLPSSVVRRLEEACDVDVFRGDDPMPYAELVGRVAGKQALLSLITDRVDAAVIEAGRDLKVVANVAVGYNNVDVAAAAARGVVVTNTPDVLTDATADMAFALILAVTRRVAEGDRLIRAGGWTRWSMDFMLGSGLAGKQLGIVGWGRIGRAVAARATAFGMQIVGSARSTITDSGVRQLGLDELLATSDVVSIHVPLGPETTHLIGEAQLARMKRGAYLVNTSRGPVVDEAALAWALRERLIAGAALDVFEDEPRVHAGLLACENVVLTPHLGSGTVETRTAMADLAARNALAVLAGQPPLTPVA